MVADLLDPMTILPPLLLAVTTGVLAAIARKMFFFPDRFLNDLFAVYRFTLSPRARAAVQVNISNIADANRVVNLVNAANGNLRYAQLFNTPRKLTVATSLSF